MRTPMLIPLLLAASPLAAQPGVAPGPRLLRVAASSDGVVLSLDSATIARTGDSTFVVDAVYQFPADTARHVGADRQVESQEMDCGQPRYRGRFTAFYSGDSPSPVSLPDSTGPRGWQPVGDDELPIFQAICGFLLGSFAKSLPITLEAASVDRMPVLVNGDVVAHALERSYPRALAVRGIGGTVRVRFQVTEEGRVAPGTARVLWATYPEFGDVALGLLPRMRFRPARLDGRDTAVWVMMPLSFSMTQDGPRPPPPPRSAADGVRPALPASTRPR